MNRDLRLLVGFLVQPFAAAALGFVTFPLIEMTGRALYGGMSADLLDAAVSVATGAGLAAFLVTQGAALPTVAWLLSRGPLTLRQVLWCGVALGNIPFALIVPLAALTRAADGGSTWFGPLAVIRALTAGSIFGLAGAMWFWLIAVRGTDLESTSRTWRRSR